MENLKEDFFHYIWKTKNFNFQSLKTTEGHALHVEHFGFHNHNAGPDFSEAKIILEKQAWFGNIELHVKSSDWYKHNHHKDTNYNSVILHVSYIHDRDIINAAGQKIPAIELKSRLNKEAVKNYFAFKDKATFIACEDLIASVDKLEIELFKENLLVDRIMQKTKILERIYQETRHDWQESWHRYFMRSLGAPVNQDAFESTAIATPFKILLKHRSNPMQVCALIFGQAGFLIEPQDQHSKSLAKEYEFLAKKYKLSSLPRTIWKFSRMRPSAFPTLRLALAAQWIVDGRNLNLEVLKMKQLNDIKQELSIELPTYWDSHYRFGKISNKVYKKKVSESLINNIIINTLVPFKFHYANHSNHEADKISAIELLRQIKPEHNKITKEWTALGINNVTAFDSQALLHLNKNYCNLKACLKCKIGHKLINSKYN